MLQKYYYESITTILTLQTLPFPIDITIVTVDLLQEMTDIEISDETEGAIDVFIDVLVSDEFMA